jgi:Flp pilus assembly pilin Flp
MADVVTTPVAPVSVSVAVPASVTSAVTGEVTKVEAEVKTFWSEYGSYFKYAAVALVGAVIGHVL